jgi:transcription termination/antitermination protein NusG
MNSRIIYNYNGWYVLQVRVKRESSIKQAIQNLCRDKYKLFIFTREILHITRGEKRKLIAPLFPGYIFLHREIDELLHLLKKNYVNEFIRPVSFNGLPALVRADEMQLLLNTCDSDGTVALSTGHVLENGKIKIIQGPLKDIEGKILFINKKKHRAKVCLSLFNRKVYVSLGLDLVQDLAATHNRILSAW